MRTTHPGKARTPFLSLIIALLLAMPARADAPSVIVSVPPIHSLVATIMAGVGTPHVLIRGGRSPHDMSLRPSDIRRLNDASLVVWVGPGLESFLVKPLARLKTETVLTLFDAPGIKALPRRTGGAWDPQDHAHDTKRGDVGLAAPGKDVPHGLSARYVDPHIWLSPENARAIIKSVARGLRDRDPANAAAYTANEARALQRIAVLDIEVGALLAPVRRTPYIVFHDAYQYFERYYGLNPAGAITTSPERQPSAHRLLEIRRQIRDSGATCVFREPQFPPRIIGAIVADTKARIGVLDPLGADIPPGPDHWFMLMRGLAGALVKCLKPGM